MLGWLRWFLARNGVALSVYMLGAVALWVIVMIVLPQLFMLDFSFRHNWQQMDPSKMGGPEDVYTLVNYHFLAYGSPNNPDPFNVVDVTVFFRTIIAAVFVTIFDLAICYPIAYYLAQVARGGKARLLVLSLIIPFWVNGDARPLPSNRPAQYVLEVNAGLAKRWSLQSGDKAKFSRL